MKRFLAVGALLLALGASARADSFNANVTAGSIGEDLVPAVNGVNQYAGTFTITNNTTGQTFTAFCADTTDTVSFGNTGFTGTESTGGLPNSVIGGVNNVNIWGATPYTDTGKRLDYLLTQVMAPSLGSLTNPEAAALQAAIWQTEGNFVSLNHITGSVSSSTLLTDLLAVLNGNTFTGTSGWAALDALNNAAGVYNTSSSVSYSSGAEILVVPASSGHSSGNPLQYQVLVGIAAATPEPSTFAIAGLGALGFLGYGWKRRKSS